MSATRLPASRRPIGLLIIATVATSCTPLSEVTFGPREPDPARASTTATERTTTRALRAAAVNDRVEVALEATETCREVTRLPMRQRVDEKRTIPDGAIANVGLGVAAAALAALGTGLLVMKCPNCRNSGDEAEIRVVGATTLGLATLPLSFLIVNGVQSVDRRAVVPVEPEQRSGESRTCGHPPVSGKEITVEAGGEQIRATTDAGGRASIPIPRSAPEPAVRAVVRSSGAPDVSIDLPPAADRR